MAETTEKPAESPRIPSRRDTDADRAHRMGISASARPGHASRGQRVIEGIKTFLWVAPLTILIWVYAEREQRDEVRLGDVRLLVRSSSPERIVTLNTPSTGSVELELSGPKAGLDTVRDILNRPLELTIPDQYPPGIVPITLIDLLARGEIFSKNGVSIERATPPTINVQVQNRKTIRVPVKVKPDALFTGTAKFEPETVELSGPTEQVDKVMKDAVAYAEMSRFRDRGPGTYPAEEVNLSLLDKTAEGVTFNPPRVKATVTIQPSAEVRLNAVPLKLLFTASDLRTYSATRSMAPEKPTVTQVGVVGPVDVIRQIQDGTIPVDVVVPISTADWNESELRLTLKAEWYRVPNGVVVTNPDQTVTVTVRRLE